MTASAAAIRQSALARAAAGDDAGAARLFAEGLAAFPHDAAFANSAGRFHNGAGRPTEALALFDRALAIQPALHEAAINRCVVLPKLGRAAEAVVYLRERETALAGVPRYWTTRAAAELAADDTDGAAASYDRALSREPGNPRALRGRAWTALHRGEDDAVAAHDRALAACPGDPDLFLGLAKALAAAGSIDEALSISSALATQLPGNLPGLELHAELRWGAGDRDRFTDHYGAAARAVPSPALYASWAAMLGGVDRHAEAADVLARGRTLWPGDGNLALAEAIAAGEAGDDRQAGAIFAASARTDAAWRISAARQTLRTQDPQAADHLLAAALEDAPDDVTGWSLRDLCWRLLDDPRHGWLHGHSGAVRSIALDLSTEELADIRALLDRLHDRAAMPIGQSVKHGSQTRGALFGRTEPEVARLRSAIDRAVADYRSTLPPQDPTHPLLKHRDAAWTIAGSWSIRLAGTGHHAAHIHPHGILSSAAYFVVPPAGVGDDRAGWLEVGRPPANLRLDLPPVAEIEPIAGRCVLFPSTLFHGTRPIVAGKRMTVAFDVNVA